MEAKESILKQIEEIKTKEDALYPLLFPKRAALSQERDRYERYKQSLKTRYSKNYDEGNLEAHERETLAEHKDIIMLLQESLSKAEADMNELAEKKNALQKTLNEFITEVTENDVLEYQQKVSEAQKEVDAITLIIQEKTDTINNTRNIPSRLNDLTTKKEDILAEIALGKNLQKELEDITREVEAEKKLLVKREQTITEIEKAMPGLNRKLSMAKESLQNLENQKNEILIQYLRYEAEQVGEEYGAAALNLIDKYNRLVSLDALIIFQSGETISTGSFHDFSIPAFHLNSLSSLISPHMPQELVTARMACSRENKNSAITREKKRIGDLGIAL